MSTYDYKCKECDHVQEEVHSISAAPEIKCELCGSVCEKIFSTSGNFVLKGNDWPSQNFRTKGDMGKKNERMKLRMKEREHAGEGITRLS